MNPESPPFEIYHLQAQDVQYAADLNQVFVAAFGEEDTPEVRSFPVGELLGRPDFLAFVVLQEGQVVGGLTAYVLTSFYNGEKEAFVYTIALLPQVQRGGIGKALWTVLLEHCRKHDIRFTFVTAHEEDEGAVKFYQSIGGEEEAVRQFGFEVKSSPFPCRRKGG